MKSTPAPPVGTPANPTTPMRRLGIGLALFLLGLGSLQAEDKPAEAKPEVMIRVYVALCDNATQGILPVPARIGDGDVPRANLYWGCSDGMRLYFINSSRWKLVEETRNEQPGAVVLATLRFRHTTRSGVELVAYAYRGSEIKACLAAFEDAVGGAEMAGELVAFIGHNGLMDFDLPMPKAAETGADAVVLCCRSRAFFAERLEAMGARPVLLTEQLMYPGSFILHEAIEGWLRKESRSAIRGRAAGAYARNQKISVRAARGVFTKWPD